MVFRVIDHSSIYLLIAGTYTPFLWVGLRGAWGITLLCVIWALAIIGIVFKVIFTLRFRKLSVAGYLLMGWLVVIAARQLWLNIPHGGLIWLAVGGFFYTFGVVFYAWKRLPYNHAMGNVIKLSPNPLPIPLKPQSMSSQPPSPLVPSSGLLLDTPSFM
jgi:hemolysin III